MYITVNGIVLSSVKYGDFDRLVTVLTDSGKIFFKARGIRSVTSKNAAGCAKFCYSEFVLNKTGDKYFLSRATPIYSAIKAGVSIETLALASYFAQICEDTALDAETGEAAKKMLINALFVIAKEDRPLDLIKAVFEMRILALLGFSPLFDECAICGKDAFLHDTSYLRLNEGDFICPECRTENMTSLIKISREISSFMKRSVSVTDSEAYAVKLPEDLMRDFSYAAERFLISQLERKYETLDYYNHLKKADI